MLLPFRAGVFLVPLRFVGAGGRISAVRSGPQMQPPAVARVTPPVLASSPVTGSDETWSSRATRSSSASSRSDDDECDNVDEEQENNDVSVRSVSARGEAKKPFFLKRSLKSARDQRKMENAAVSEEQMLQLQRRLAGLLTTIASTSACSSPPAANRAALGKEASCSFQAVDQLRQVDSAVDEEDRGVDEGQPRRCPPGEVSSDSDVPDLPAPRVKTSQSVTVMTADRRPSATSATIVTRASSSKSLPPERVQRTISMPTPRTTPLQSQAARHQSSSAVLPCLRRGPGNERGSNSCLPAHHAPRSSCADRTPPAKRNHLEPGMKVISPKLSAAWRSRRGSASLSSTAASSVSPASAGSATSPTSARDSRPAGRFGGARPRTPFDGLGADDADAGSPQAADGAVVVRRRWSTPAPSSPGAKSTPTRTPQSARGAGASNASPDDGAAGTSASQSDDQREERKRARQERIDEIMRKRRQERGGKLQMRKPPTDVHGFFPDGTDHVECTGCPGQIITARL